ncbi:MAG: type IV-A pilus assembly ATPase PilB [Gammaproteobacteria bacterium]|nr:MAG: type IV-A pilus assembly ATPase PilB [Gammaproteobacteria bacterium]PHR83998.1 MAG: type IV-A pilus assembly ATPase PilB [Colwellia sp.]
MQFDLSHLSINRDDIEFSISDPISAAVEQTDINFQDMDARSFLNKTLLDAVKAGASDIHLEPYEREFRIRYRVDGILRDASAPPKNFGQLLSIRLKVISALDISEHKATQVGRFRMALTPDFSVDFRASITPTLHGETIVLRLLYLPEELLELENLGLSYEQVETIHQTMETMNGLTLVSGPTGSGKTVTLYTLMKMLNIPERSIYTVEDPVEIHMNGINQVNVNEKQGVTFASIAKTMLRQDPDVIVLGEMRDKETVDTAVKAAHTGHLVLSTLHANDAAKVIPRLRNLGVDGYDIASTVNLIIAQRLLRKLDHDSKESYLPNKKELKDAGVLLDQNRLKKAKSNNSEPQDIEVNEERYRARASRKNPSGYRGREGIFQVVPMTKQLAQMIIDGATDIEIDQYCQAQGYKTLRDMALDKADKGITDLAEVIRVLGPARD